MRFSVKYLCAFLPLSLDLEVKIVDYWGEINVQAGENTKSSFMVFCASLYVLIPTGWIFAPLVTRKKNLN